MGERRSKLLQKCSTRVSERVLANTTPDKNLLTARQSLVEKEEEVNAALLRKAGEQNSEYRERLAGLRHRCIELYTPNGFTFHHGLFSGMRFLLMKREFFSLIWRRRSLFSTAV